MLVLAALFLFLLVIFSCNQSLIIALALTYKTGHIKGQKRRKPKHWLKRGAKRDSPLTPSLPTDCYDTLELVETVETPVVERSWCIWNRTFRVYTLECLYASAYQFDKGREHSTQVFGSAQGPLFIQIPHS